MQIPIVLEMTTFISHDRVGLFSKWIWHKRYISRVWGLVTELVLRCRGGGRAEIYGQDTGCCIWNGTKRWWQTTQVNTEVIQCKRCGLPPLCSRKVIVTYSRSNSHHLSSQCFEYNTRPSSSAQCDQDPKDLSWVLGSHVMPPGSSTRSCHRVLPQDPVTGFCHRVLPLGSTTRFCHGLQLPGSATCSY